MEIEMLENNKWRNTGWSCLQAILKDIEGLVHFISEDNLYEYIIVHYPDDDTRVFRALKINHFRKETFKDEENKMNMELWKEDGSWVECSWSTFKEFKQFIEDYEDIYIIDNWIVDNYSYIVVHWMDEDTAKFRRSLSPDTSEIHGALESCKLDYKELAEAVVEALKKDCETQIEEVKNIVKPKVEILIKRDKSNLWTKEDFWSDTNWINFEEIKSGEYKVLSSKEWSDDTYDYIAVRYHNGINVFRRVSRAD